MEKSLNNRIVEAIENGIYRALFERRLQSETFRMEIGENVHRLYIGDPCYILPDDIYEKYIIDGYGVLPKGLGITHGTYNGDGTYDSDICKRSYGVDSGNLAIIACGSPLFNREPVDERFNREIEMDGKKHNLSMTYKSNGWFIFKIDGKVIEKIYTGIVDKKGKPTKEK